MPETKQFVPCGVEAVINGKNAEKVDTIFPWLYVHLQKWIEMRPTGSATFTIEINANQGGIGKIGTGFTIKESI